MITPRIAWPCAGDGSFKFLPYQLSMFGYWPNMVATGNGGLGLDPGEGALYQYLLSLPPRIGIG